MSMEAMRIAGQQIGLNEVEQNAALSEFMANGGVNLDPAVTAWCAAFVNASLAQAGQDGTGSNMARSFMDWGNPVDQPQQGDLAVFSRGDPNGPFGHVGFFQGYDDAGNILVLGGNQSNSVNVSPYSADRLLGFRRGGNALADGVPPPPNALAGASAPGMGQDPRQNALAMLDQFRPRTNALNPNDFMVAQAPMQLLPMPGIS